jgi:hypothetical protein
VTCNEWFKETFQNAQMLAVADDGADDNGVDIEQNAWSISANIITGDKSSPLATNAAVRKKLQTALNGRSTMTKDGVPIQVLQATKKMRRRNRLLKSE